MGREAKAKAERKKGRSLLNEMRRQGIFEQMQAVQAALQSPRFRAGFTKLLGEVRGNSREPRDNDGIRALAIEVLDGMLIEHSDVLITVTWNPSVNRTLTFSCSRPQLAAITRCKAILDGKMEKVAA